MKKIKTEKSSDKSRKHEQNGVVETEREMICPGSHNTWGFAGGIELQLPDSVQRPLGTHCLLYGGETMLLFVIK